MNIPAFFNPRFTKEDGSLTNEMQLFFDELMQALQNGVSNNGFVFPEQDTATITALADMMPDGTAWYNTDIDLPQMKVGGVVKTFTLT